MSQFDYYFTISILLIVLHPTLVYVQCEMSLDRTRTTPFNSQIWYELHNMYIHTLHFKGIAAIKMYHGGEDIHQKISTSFRILHDAICFSNFIGVTMKIINSQKCTLSITVKFILFTVLKHFPATCFPISIPTLLFIPEPHGKPKVII